MSSFGAKLKAIRAKNNWTQEQLAQKLHTSKQVISRYETGQRTPKITVAQAFAEALHLPLRSLLEDAAPCASAADISPGLEPLPQMKWVPLLGTIACGEPIYAAENFDGYVDSPESVHADMALRCKGDSMVNARILDGDLVFIRIQEDVENGEIAAVLIDGEATLKRVYKYENRVVLQPENPKYAPLVYVGEQLQDFRILGKAVAFMSRAR